MDTITKSSASRNSASLSQTDAMLADDRSRAATGELLDGLAHIDSVTAKAVQLCHHQHVAGFETLKQLGESRSGAGLQ